MVGLLGVLAAGAAQSYGAAKNQEVDNHNAVAMEQMREQIRQDFEERRFNRQLEAGMQQAKMQAEHENYKYQRNREDKLSDEEIKHNRDMEKNRFIEENKNRRTADSNATRMKSTEMRIAAQRELAKSGGGNGLLNVGDKAQSTMGKAIQDMVNMGLASSPQEAQMKLDRAGVLKEMMKNPLMAADPKRMTDAVRQWENAMGMQNNQQQTVADFVFNPQTGKLEPAR